MARYRYVQRRSIRSGRTTQARLERKCACGGHSHGAEQCDACAQKAAAGSRHGSAPETVTDALNSPSHPLDMQTREFMESHFSHDFSGVRIHEAPAAAESANVLDAQAYTVGRDVVFADHRYAPGTSAGRQLLAHELAHVVQQGDADRPGGSIALDETESRERRADEAANSPAELLNLDEGSQPAIAQAALQRQKATSKDGAGDAEAGAGPAASSCVQEVVGKAPPTLTEAGVVTVVDFGAEWCGPCKMLEPQLADLCSEYQRKPLGKPVRFYKVDVSADGNEAIGNQYAAQSVPQVYIYAGTQLAAHFDTYFETIDVAIREIVEEAAKSGFMRGAGKGWKWGLGIGGAAGLAGAIAVGQSGLSGNAKMLGILGSLVGGAAVGAGLGALTGGIIGHAMEEKPASGNQKKKLQTKSMSGGSNDRLEREADETAARVVNSRPANVFQRWFRGHPAPSPDHSFGQPLEPPVRNSMERAFDADFRDVRVHRGGKADRVTSAMDAAAVTSGSDIYFAPGEYAPEKREGTAVLSHELTHVLQTGDQKPAPFLPIKRWQKTLLGGAIGLGGGAVLGAAAGAGIAALTHGNIGQGLGIGAAIGGGLGLLGGLLTGFFTRRKSLVGAAEAEALIQRHYGRYMHDRTSGPLHNAVVHPVSSAELCERYKCRHPDDSCNLIGWTDTGVPWRAGAPPDQTIPSQEEEPACNGRQMEHATPERPVIYYDNTTDDAAVVIHEGMHAHSHPSYQSLLNYVNEGTTEYFTRQVQEDVNIAPYGGYDEEVADIEKLIGIVGEEPFARAYFGGHIDELHSAVDAVLGPCALREWSADLQMNSPRRADEVIQGRGVNYCGSTGSSTAPAAEHEPEMAHAAEASHAPEPPHV